jgi:hypothetical protein
MASDRYFLYPRAAEDPPEAHMKRRLFTDANVSPTEALLRKQLGSAITYYLGIMAKSGDYRKQWQYSRGNGWILKVDDMRKALYYLIPLEEGIEISLTVRDSERESLLANKDVEYLFPQLESATKYSEGYALRFDIESQSDCTAVIRFLQELMKMRSSLASVTAGTSKRNPRK